MWHKFNFFFFFSEHCSKSLSGDEAFSYLSSAIKEGCSQGHMVVQTGGYSDLADRTFPAVVADCRQPFHLHAQNGDSPVTPTRSQLQAHLTDLSGPSSGKESQSQKTPTREECEEQRKASVTSRKLQQVRNDIVTSNKITLGRSTKTHGSYLKTHARKQDVLFQVRVSLSSFRSSIVSSCCYIGLILWKTYLWQVAVTETFSRSCNNTNDENRTAPSQN